MHEGSVFSLYQRRGDKAVSMKGNSVTKVLKTHMGVLITLLALWVFFSIASPWFSSLFNMLNILNHMTITLILSLGMVFVIASGGIDLSVGSILGFTGIVMAMLFKANVPIVVTVILGFAVGGGIGALTGLIISKFRLQPFIVTLGMLSIVRGLALVLSRGLPILGFPPRFTHFFAGTAGIPTNIYIMVFLVILVAIIANRTRFGIYARCIGGSEKSAILCGFGVDLSIRRRARGNACEP